MYDEVHDERTIRMKMRNNLPPLEDPPLTHETLAVYEGEVETVKVFAYNLVERYTTVDMYWKAQGQDITGFCDQFDQEEIMNEEIEKKRKEEEKRMQEEYYRLNPHLDPKNIQEQERIQDQINKERYEQYERYKAYERELTREYDEKMLRETDYLVIRERRKIMQQQ